MTKLRVQFTLLLLVVLVSVACGQAQMQSGPAPGFIATDTNGQTFSLPDQRGKVVVLFFTSVGCTVCTTQLPEMARFHQDYRDKGVALAAINVLPEYSNEEFVAYMKKNGAGDHAFIAENGPRIARSFGIQSTGITVIIDKAGNRVATVGPPGLTYTDLRARVERLQH